MIKYEEHIYPFNSCLYYAVLHGRTTFKKVCKADYLVPGGEVMMTLPCSKLTRTVCIISMKILL